MQVIYYENDIPETVNRSIFLAGPTPRSSDVQSWRPEALNILEKSGYDGVVYVPERNSNKRPDFALGYEGMIEWEKKRLNQADVILFWVPRNMKTLPGITTNFEAGMWLKSGKCVYGRPDGAPHTAYLDSMYEDITKKIPHTSLTFTINEAIAKEPVGFPRTGGERFVPLQIWKTEAFQKWYQTHKDAGNRLDDARQLWSFIPRGSDKVFSFVLWVKIWIEQEQRYKENEWIFSRRDISTVVLYNYPTESNGNKAYDPLIVLVKEFRSPVRNNGYLDEDKYGELPGDKCFVFENPSGSGIKSENHFKQAAEEVKEETSLIIEPGRIKSYGSKQVCATLSTHHSHLFGCQLTDEEMNKAIKIAASGKSFGIESDSEKTYLFVCRLSQLPALCVDWATIGMVYSVVKR